MAFETELNFGLHKTNLDSTTDAVTIMAGGAIATAVDFGASVWNSLPGTPEVETADLLSRISNDALRVYQENPDTIHAASFISGMFVPMGLASKAMGAMRSGVKGANWFSNAGREASLAKVTEMFDGAQGATAEYRALTRGIYAKNAVNQAIDAVAMEAALVGTMSAHPFMEDYMKDLGSNFALSALLGGGIGAGIAGVADRFILKGLEGAVLEKAFDATISSKVLRTVGEDMTHAMQLQSFNVNIKNLDVVMEQRKALGKDATNDLTFGIAENVQLKLKADSVELFESMISADIKALPKTEKDVFMRSIIDKPEMFGAENFKFLSPKEYADQALIKAPKDALELTPKLKEVDAFTQVVRNKEAVYFPELGLFGIKSDAIHYAGASVLGKNAEELAKLLPYNYGKIANFDSSLELLGKSSAHVEAEYIGAIVKVQKMSVKDFQAINLSDADGPLLNAVINRMKMDPDVSDLSMKLADRTKLNDAIFKETTETLVKGGKMAPGPDASYKVAMEKIGDDIDINLYNPRRNKISSKSLSMLKGWVGAQQAEMRKAFVDWQTQHFSGFKGGMDGTAARAFDELINSPQSKQLREDFGKIADAEGNVYLYRGLKTDKLFGSQPLESFTTHISKAEQFGDASSSSAKATGGGVKLFKVHVDDIVASFQDIGGGANNAEIIVKNAARPIEAELTAAGKMNFLRAAEGESTTTIITREIPVGAAQSTKDVSISDLEKLLMAQKEDAIGSLIANGIPFESIAKKTNTPVDIVKAYALIKQNHGLDVLIPPGELPSVILNTIKGEDDIAKVLKPSNQPLVIGGNIKKNPYVMNHIALDNRQMSIMQKEFTAQSMYASKSQAVKEIADMFYHPEGLGIPLDVVRSVIGKANNSYAGAGFINSFDFFARNMGEIGPIISKLAVTREKITNDTIRRVLHSMEDSMVALQKSPGAAIEFSNFYNMNAGLKGWRMITPEGKIVQKVEKVGEDGKAVTVLEPIVYKDGPYQGQVFEMKTKEAIKLAQDMAGQSPELKALSDAANRIKGTPDVVDIGMWIPSFNPVNKFIAYVHNAGEDTTKLLVARSEKEFETVVNEYRKYIKEQGKEGVEEIVVNTKAQQADWNRLNGRLDPITMERADISMQKTGSSALAIVKPDISMLGEIAAGYEHYVNAQVRNLMDLNLSDITDSLRRISSYNNRNFVNQPLDEVKKMAVAPKDSAKLVLNQILGGNNLGEYAAWNTVSKTFETGLNMAANKVSDTWKATTAPFRNAGKDLTSENVAKMKDTDFLAMNQKLEAQGIQYPWKDFDRATAEKLGFMNIESNPDTTKRIVYASNGLAATMLLRFGDLAQPLVNAMSMPILTGLAIAQKMPESFMGIQKATTNVSGVQIMYEGARAMHSPLFEKLNKRWEAEGLFTPMVSEVTSIMRASRRFDKGLTAAIENGLDSNLVKIMSKPADYAESLTRKVAMNTGAVLAKRLYPELDDVGVTIFARNFMDKAIGNFHATQRPVFFQGTLGVALGLFQTYSLTLAQSVYRNLELKNYKALGTAALTQSGIFGAGSMPGFQQISQAIGNHYSDDNVDLVTGTYRAVGDKAADFILYGLPSNIGVGNFSTRGDTTPRIPNLLAGADNVVAVNFAKQAVGAVGQISSAMGTEYPEMGRAIGQALSLQNMSRPVARVAELATGYSLTQRGNTVQVPEEVWSFTGVASRLMATRPIEEQKLRDADHLNHVYGAMDRDNREKLTKSLRTGIRNGTLSNEAVAKYSDEYLRHGGSPAGWEAAKNTALAKTETSGKEVFAEKLKPNSALNYMIGNL